MLNLGLSVCLKHPFPVFFNLSDRILTTIVSGMQRSNNVALQEFPFSIIKGGLHKSYRN